MMFLLAALFVSLASWLITGQVRRYALQRSLLDVPNERSSHLQPTPRGGGLAIVVVLLISLPAASFAGVIEWAFTWALLGAGGLVAAIGLRDDLRHVAARWRLLCHFAAASWALWWLGGPPPLALFELRVELGWVGLVCALLYLVWLLNLFNFMDGIDALAGIETVTVCLGGALLWLAVGLPEAAVPEVLAACAVAGFLLWNLPPARIFLGDVGSGFLGITVGLLSLHAAWLEPQLLWSWLILMGVFIVDATFTLFRRLLDGHASYQAHRSHAYQKAARRCKAHLPVSLAVGAINLLWLLPLALAVALGWIEGLLALMVAYAPLLAVVVKHGAGKEGPVQAPG